MHLIIGSRGSELALYQANLIKSYLAEKGATAEIKIIKTVGDKIDNVSFDQMEGKSFFTKELEDALLSHDIDLAVHSLKDLSTQIPPGLKIGAFCNPEDPSELLLVRPEKYDPDQKLFLVRGATIGTSSVRRQAQIAYIRPDLHVEPLRGNVPTRVRKLTEGKYDAILIARAGVERLNLDTGNLKAFTLDRSEFIPAPGQGILAIEIRENDPQIETIIAKLNNPNAEVTARLERGLLARFEGGCQLPLAVTSSIRNDKYILRAFLGNRDGNGWGRPSQYSGGGKVIDELIEKAFLALSHASDHALANHKKKVLITRTEEEGAKFFSSCSDSITVIYYPVFEIIPQFSEEVISKVVAELDSFDWIIFTSKNTVRILHELLQKRRAALSSSTRIASVGRKTSELLESLGYKVDFVPAREDSTGLTEGLLSLVHSEKANVLLPQGEEAPDLIEMNLAKAGHKVERINLYKTSPADPKKLPEVNSQEIDFFIFTSPLSVKYYKILGQTLPDKSWVAAIGRPTADALKEYFRAPDYIPVRANLNDIAMRIKEQL